MENAWYPVGDSFSVYYKFHPVFLLLPGYLLLYFIWAPPESLLYDPMAHILVSLPCQRQGLPVQAILEYMRCDKQEGLAPLMWDSWDGN